MDSNQMPRNNHTQTNTEGNAVAIIGLVLAFLFWPAGLVCSIIGLKKAKKLGGKGHGIALAGLIMSIVVGVVFVIPVFVFFGAPALQRNDRNADRKTDIVVLRGAIETYANNHSGSIPSSNTELDTALAAVDLYFYDGTVADGLTATDTQADAITGRGGVAIEQAAAITSADFSPTVDEVQIILQARCKSTSSLALNTAYTAKGANLVTETTGVGDFVIVYGLEGETNVICEDRG